MQQVEGGSTWLWRTSSRWKSLSGGQSFSFSMAQVPVPSSAGSCLLPRACVQWDVL
jgi:hypothetical protein